MLKSRLKKGCTVGEMAVQRPRFGGVILTVDAVQKNTTLSFASPRVIVHQVVFSWVSDWLIMWKICEGWKPNGTGFSVFVNAQLSQPKVTTHSAVLHMN